MDISGYRLGREVESGNCWATYNALDAHAGRTVVVRVYDQQLSSNPAFREHFQSITSRLRHHILGSNVRVLDAVMVDDHCALVTNYCPLSSSQHTSILNRDVNGTLEISRKLATSLSLLHNLGVVHGGIEPANIRFVDNQEMILGPVAMHRTLPSLEQSLCITCAEEEIYRAPEADYGLVPGSDFFSLGVLLYQWLTGEQPYPGDSSEEILQRKQSGEFSPLTGDLAYLQPLFRGLLSPNPLHRISSANDFVVILDQCPGLKSNDKPVVKRTSVAAVSGTGGGGAGITADSSKSKLSSRQKRSGRFSRDFAIVILILVVALAGWVFMKMPMSKTKVLTEMSESLPKATATNEKAENTGNSVYLKARKLLTSGNHQDALKVINMAAPGDTDYELLSELRTAIEHEEEVLAGLRRAGAQFAEGKMIMPPGDNAFESYQRIAHLTFRDDPRVEQGLQNIAEHFLNQARQQLESKQLEDFKKTLVMGLMVMPDYRPLTELIGELDK
jgi:serine/threonine protein kinase